jgi:CHAT domain-containing protein
VCLYLIIFIQKSTDPPRLIWCCTGALALLPIHAAGIYTGPENISISDFVVSSYTPTLSHLLSPTQTIVEQVKLLLVGQSNSPGHAPIPNVSLELKRIQAVIKTTVTNTICVPLESGDATHNNVLAEMASSHITHLACHGTASRDPLDSAVVLHDGNLKVGTLMRTPLADARLVFLSACETAQTNPSEPDESIHIAAAMLFAGFKGAIATMWAINDNDAPQIAESFYRNIIKVAL